MGMGMGMGMGMAYRSEHLHKVHFDIGPLNTKCLF